MPTTKSEIIQFLKDFKKEMSDNGLTFVERKVNLDCLAELGLSIVDGEGVILSLTEKDFQKGPELDHDGSVGEIWAFQKHHAGAHVYIKLKLDSFGAKCISFHKRKST